MKVKLKFAQSPSDFEIKPYTSKSKLSAKLTKLLSGFLADKEVKEIYTLNIRGNNEKEVKSFDGLMKEFVDNLKDECIGLRGLIVVYKDDVVFYDSSMIAKNKTDFKQEDSVIYNYSVHSLKKGLNGTGLIYENGKWIEKPLRERKSYKYDPEWIKKSLEFSEEKWKVEILGDKKKPQKYESGSPEISKMASKFIELFATDKLFRGNDKSDKLVIACDYHDTYQKVYSLSSGRLTLAFIDRSEKSKSKSALAIQEGYSYYPEGWNIFTDSEVIESNFDNSLEEMVKYVHNYIVSK